MSEEKKEQNKMKPEHKNAAVKPDPETTETTDPQEHMKGPVSSLMQGAEDFFDTDETGTEEERKRNN